MPLFLYGGLNCEKMCQLMGIALEFGDFSVITGINLSGCLLSRRKFFSTENLSFRLLRQTLQLFMIDAMPEDAISLLILIS